MSKAFTKELVDDLANKLRNELDQAILDSYINGRPPCEKYIKRVKNAARQVKKFHDDTKPSKIADVNSYEQEEDLDETLVEDSIEELKPFENEQELESIDVYEEAIEETEENILVDQSLVEKMIL